MPIELPFQIYIAAQITVLVLALAVALHQRQHRATIVAYLRWLTRPWRLVVG